jgi:four helix bundle protein
MKTHQSLDAWKVARQVALAVIEAARAHWKPWAAALFGQLLRASLSVQLNIAEGATFGRSPSYVRHLAIAYGSAVESAELIELLKESRVLPEEVAAELTTLSKRSQQLLVGLLKRHRPMH